MIIPKRGEDLEKLAQRCQALYIGPTKNGKRIGPLVPYAGKDEQGRNYVGYDYFNFRMIESRVLLVEEFARVLRKKAFGYMYKFDTVCGIPNGGRTLGQPLAKMFGKRYVYAVKVPIPTPEGEKQEYDLDLSEFTSRKGERVALVDDVFHNFRNAQKAIDAIEKAGAVPVLLLGALNRSLKYKDVYSPEAGAFESKKIPVICAITKLYLEYKQDDPIVSEGVAKGNVIFDVKKSWPRLMKLMAEG